MALNPDAVSSVEDVKFGFRSVSDGVNDEPVMFCISEAISAPSAHVKLHIEPGERWLIQQTVKLASIQQAIPQGTRMEPFRMSSDGKNVVCVVSGQQKCFPKEMFYAPEVQSTPDEVAVPATPEEVATSLVD
jgi:hypothetical protein